VIFCIKGMHLLAGEIISNNIIIPPFFESPATGTLMRPKYNSALTEPKERREVSDRSLDRSIEMPVSGVFWNDDGLLLLNWVVVRSCLFYLFHSARGLVGCHFARWGRCK